MKSQEEIARLYDRLANEFPGDWQGDNFKYGMHIGKILTLGWILDEEKSGEVSILYDYESWMREVRILSEDISEELKKDDEENSPQTDSA